MRIGQPRAHTQLRESGKNRRRTTRLRRAISQRCASHERQLDRTRVVEARGMKKAGRRPAFLLTGVPKGTAFIAPIVYDFFAFGFRPGAAGGMKPETRPCHASNLRPFSNWIVLHTIASRLSARAVRCCLTIARGTRISFTNSTSRRCPCFLRHCKVSVMGHVLSKGSDWDWEKNAHARWAPLLHWRPHGDSNPGYRRERAVS